jgi:hypothetical protein
VLEDGSWVQVEVRADEDLMRAGLRALESSDERVRGAACVALKSLALTLADATEGGEGGVVRGRLTQMAVLSQGHALVVPVLVRLVQEVVVRCEGEGGVGRGLQDVVWVLVCLGAVNASQAWACLM